MMFLFKAAFLNTCASYMHVIFTNIAASYPVMALDPGIFLGIFPW